MMDYEAKLAEMGLTLPAPCEAGGNYVPLKEFGDHLVYVSGTGGEHGDFYPQGSIGKEFTVEQGIEIARDAMLNILAGIRHKYGSLNRIKSVVKLTVFVAGAEGFYEQHVVANGATNLLVSLFGKEIGLPSRSAVGMYALPDRMPIEVEGLFEITD